jgi:enamine deaminase RidA (YjgF/YER057c/UK114 family)
MTGRDDEGKLVTGIEAQTIRALERVAHTLKEESLSLDNIGRARIYLIDPDDWRHSVASALNVFFRTNSPPVTVIGVARLADPAALIEIEVDVVIAQEASLPDVAS